MLGCFVEHLGYLKGSNFSISRHVSPNRSAQSIAGVPAYDGFWCDRLPQIPDQVVQDYYHFQQRGEQLVQPFFVKWLVWGQANLPATFRRHGHATPVDRAQGNRLQSLRRLDVLLLPWFLSPSTYFFR